MSSIAGGGELYATTYARGCEEWAQFRGFEISIVAALALQSGSRMRKTEIDANGF